MLKICEKWMWIMPNRSESFECNRRRYLWLIHNGCRLLGLLLPHVDNMPTRDAMRLYTYGWSACVWFIISWFFGEYVKQGCVAFNAFDWIQASIVSGLRILWNCTQFPRAKLILLPFYMRCAHSNQPIEPENLFKYNKIIEINTFESYQIKSMQITWNKQLKVILEKAILLRSIGKKANLLKFIGTKK